MLVPTQKEIIEERKAKAIETLSTGFAVNRLPLEEYERLVEYINKTENERELVIVEKIVAEYGENGTLNEQPEDDEPDYYSGRDIFQNNTAILSSRTFSGPIKSGAKFVSLLGSEHIKIRIADLRKRRTVLNVVSILGECKISVEAGIRVSNNAIPVFGSASVDKNVDKQARDMEPELIISGVSLLGDINVKLLK